MFVMFNRKEYSVHKAEGTLHDCITKSIKMLTTMLVVEHKHDWDGKSAQSIIVPVVHDKSTVVCDLQRIDGGGVADLKQRRNGKYYRFTKAADCCTTFPEITRQSYLLSFVHFLWQTHF